MFFQAMLAGLAIAGLTASAKADRFHFVTPADAKKIEGNAPSYVDGVLLREENGNYVIRVDGGEITIPKASVKEIEKTALTVADLEKGEKDARERLADLNKRRTQVQAAEAAARRSEAQAREAAAAQEAPKEIRIVVDFQGLLPSYQFRAYDPVLHRVNLQGLAAVVEAYLREEVERAAHRRH